MKQKNDELPDEWVRQTLSRLPDAPPPGSSFDSERLWGQLRPELQAKPARWQTGWWLSAACVAGLVISWLVWPFSSTEPKTGSATSVATYRPKTESNAKPSPKQAEIIPHSDSAPAIAEAHQSKRQRNTLNKPQFSPDDVTTASISSEPEPVFQAAEPTATSVVVAVPVSRKANVAVVTPKRRFRVMHENELRAEDESAPQIYRINHFVRLGAGRRSDDESSTNGQRTTTGSENRPPALTMPLNN
ncbi:hypothetical protein [Spirosoma pomorum]